MAQDNEVVQPNFIIDEEGRVFCTKHTLFNKVPEKTEECLPPILTLFATPQPPPLTCKTCGYYFRDSCYFSATSINEIVHARDRGQIICEFCGEKITRVMSVFQKIFYENNFGVKMPLVCCGCFASLKNNDFVGQAKRNIFWWTIISFGSLFACFYYISMLFILVPWGIAAIIFGLFFWAYFSYNYIRRIYYTWKGKKRYQQLEEKFNA
ncbi:MAG: hypothetical protein RBG13Loki_3795 [Promethearchaeota archaeon CR_4]|nr:MAG: hypothetical protein RBG13Loki_3795 [Candidatus Lokiarchaeota archaeon CR_4]